MAITWEHPTADVERIVAETELPRVALVEQRLESPPAIADIPAAVREALRAVELPRGAVAVGVGSRGIGRIDEIVGALIAALKEAGARPFIVPAMGSHGSATASGQANVLAELGVTEERMGAPVRATMDAVHLGETPAGVSVYMDRNAYEADAVIVVGRVKPHTAFRGLVESGPTKMLAIGLGKQRGAHSIHAAGWANIHETIPAAAKIVIGTGKVAFGLAVLENAELRPCHLVAIPAGRLIDEEPALLAEAKAHLPRLPFERIDVLVIDRIGKNISGDGADPNVTGRYPTAYGGGGPEVERMVYLDLTDETMGNANGVGMADVTTARLAAKVDPWPTYMNALTSTTPAPVRLPMVMPSARAAIAAALTMCAGVKPSAARLVRIRSTLDLGRLWVSERLLDEVKSDPRLRIVRDLGPMEFDSAGYFREDGAVPTAAAQAVVR